MRLVREPAGDAAAELLAEPLAIGLHRDFDELLGHARVQQIDIRPAARPRRIGRRADAHDQVPLGRRQLAVACLRGHVRGCVTLDSIHADHVLAQVRRLFRHFERQSATPRFRHQPRHPTAGKARRVRVLVIDPHVHVQPLGFLQGHLPQMKPVVGQVRRHQAGPRVDERLLDVLARQIPHRLPNLSVGQHVVPDP